MANRKKIAGLFLATLLAVTLTGCGDVLDFRNAEIANGKIYKSGANEPFTGKVTNLPANKILEPQSGLSKISLVMVKTLYAGFFSGFTMTPTTYLAGSALCNVQVKNGVLDGEVICNAPNSENRVFEMAFKDGTLDGEFRYYDGKGSKFVIASVPFKNGLADGKLDVHSAATQKLIFTVTWQGGRPVGRMETYNETTGVLTHFTTFNEEGKQDGDEVSYAPDGKQVLYKVTYAAGLKNGPEDEYDAATGKPLRHEEWANGQRQGLEQAWNHQGNLIKQSTWENGTETVAPATPAPSTFSAAEIEQCVNAWITVFRKEQGADAAVSTDQLGEWQGWCKQGQRPAN